MQRLHHLVLHSVQWGWTLKIEEIFKVTKQAVAQGQTICIVDPAFPFLLTGQVYDTGFGWGLLQKHGSQKVTIGFWSQLWKSMEAWYSLIKKQLAAIYAALLASVASLALIS